MFEFRRDETIELTTRSRGSVVLRNKTRASGQPKFANHELVVLARVGVTPMEALVGRLKQMFVSK
jgi:hypothetical protein